MTLLQLRQLWLMEFLLITMPGTDGLGQIFSRLDALSCLACVVEVRIPILTASWV